MSAGKAPRTTATVRSIGWLGVRTNEFDAMLDFYRSSFGLRPVEQTSDFALIELATGDRIELFGVDGANRHFGAAPVAGFVVDDVATVSRQLAGAGIDIVHAGEDPAVGIAWAHFRAPDGNLYEITHQSRAGSAPVPTSATRPEPHRVFVTGASGVLGRHTIPQLIAAGCSVVAHSHRHTEERRSHDRVEHVRVDLLDRVALATVLTDVDAVLHLATSIPPPGRSASPDAWDINDRLRGEATAALVDAALTTAVTTVVYPSVAFVYADGGNQWLRAGSAVDASFPLASTLVAEAHVTRFAAELDRRGVVLRLGGLYGPSSAHTRQRLLDARPGAPVVPGAPDAYAPTLWENDAGTALAAALYAPTGVYDVVDDQPMTRQEITRAYDTARGAPDAPLIAGDGGAGLASSPMAFLRRSQRVSNAAFRQSTTWRPEVASVGHAIDRLAAMTENPEREVQQHAHR